MQTDTVGSFFHSSSMIICIHKDNLLIARHLIGIHEFKTHFKYVRTSTGRDPRFGWPTVCWREDVTLYQEEIWQHQSQYGLLRTGGFFCFFFFCGKTLLAIGTHGLSRYSSGAAETDQRELVRLFNFHQLFSLFFTNRFFFFFL